MNNKTLSQNEKILIIRFSSFGDIIQSLSSLDWFRQHCFSHDNLNTTWLTRSEFTHLIEPHPHCKKVISFERKQGLFGLLSIYRDQLAPQNFTLIYDAHNNLRSNLLLLLFRCSNFFKKKKLTIVQRPKSRWKRFLFFKLKDKKARPQNPKGVLSYLEPLESWSQGKPILLNSSPIQGPHLYLPETSTSKNSDHPLNKLPESFIAFAPSAAWENKRWPISKWQELVKSTPQHKIILLGGPEDHFCEDIASVAPERVINLAGQLSLIESCTVVSQSKMLVSADTGLLHVADQLAHLNIGLIGPTAFGYTSGKKSHIMETQLSCKPCSKDGRTPCRNKIYQRCMVDITPKNVAKKIQELILC